MWVLWGKHKAATQWVDYKLGLSFKQTEFINTEFPHTPLAGLSLCAYICGSNTHTLTDTHTMALLAFWSLSVGAWACIVFAPTCALSLVCFHTSCPFLSADSVSLTGEERWTDICNGEKSVNEHTHWFQVHMGKQMLMLQVWRWYYRKQHHFLWDDVMCANQRGIKGTIPQTFCLIALCSTTGAFFNLDVALQNLDMHPPIPTR